MQKSTSVLLKKRDAKRLGGSPDWAAAGGFNSYPYQGTSGLTGSLPANCVYPVSALGGLNLVHVLRRWYSVEDSNLKPSWCKQVALPIELTEY